MNDEVTFRSIMHCRSRFPPHGDIGLCCEDTYLSSKGRGQEHFLSELVKMSIVNISNSPPVLSLGKMNGTAQHTKPM